MKKKYRNGGIGAIMDEYERAASELTLIVSALTDAEFERIRDPHTSNPHCRSVQTIMNHVIGSGYGDADYIRQAFSLPSESPTLAVLGRSEALDELKRMLAYTERTLDGRWTYSDEQTAAVQIDSHWGVRYDMEQLLEHGLVHILRHRRQIERFIGR